MTLISSIEFILKNNNNIFLSQYNDFVLINALK